MSVLLTGLVVAVVSLAWKAGRRLRAGDKSGSDGGSLIPADGGHDGGSHDCGGHDAGGDCGGGDGGGSGGGD